MCGSKKGSKKVYVASKCIKATSQSGQKMAPIVKEILREKKLVHSIARKKFGTPKCKKGEIIKEGYKKSKTGKWVKPVCIESRTGNLQKREQLFYLEPHRLSKYGYDELIEKPDTQRHAALKVAVTAGEKPLSVSRRLNALSILTKNTNPKLSQKFKEDSEWIKHY